MEDLVGRLVEVDGWMGGWRTWCEVRYVSMYLCRYMVRKRMSREIGVGG